MLKVEISKYFFLGKATITNTQLFKVLFLKKPKNVRAADSSCGTKFSRHLKTSFLVNL